MNNQDFKVVQGVGHGVKKLMISKEALNFIFSESARSSPTTDDAGKSAKNNQK